MFFTKPADYGWAGAGRKTIQVGFLIQEKGGTEKDWETGDGGEGY